MNNFLTTKYANIWKNTIFTIYCQTWQEALEYCQSLGMRLASVTSDLQLYALNQVETTKEFPNIAGNLLRKQNLKVIFSGTIIYFFCFTVLTGYCRILDFRQGVLVDKSL